MTPLRAPVALNNATVAQLHQDRLQELARDMLPLRDFRRRRPAVTRKLLRERGRGSDGIFAFAG